MKNIILILLSISLMFACKQATNDSVQVESVTQESIDYPDALDKVFDNHGSVDKWKAMKAMTFEIVKEGGNEKTITDLYNRHERIEGNNFTSGYDGKNYWVVADSTYKGNPKFYTNLMFYFYAMPFVLADDGINYDKVADLVFEDKSYPGYRISYGDDIGISPKDEYFVHFDPNSYEMAWLGYTVTFRSGEKSENIKWIRYNDWKEYSGLKLPKSLTWYKAENNLPTEVRSTRDFDGIVVSVNEFSSGTFDMPEGAETVD